VSVRPLIEQWFPAATTGAESLRDASAAKEPPNSRLHVWWARRPLTASRAAVVASLLPAWPDDEATADPEAAAARKTLEAEFPGGEGEYHRWFVRTMGILGDPVAGKARIAAAKVTGERLDDGGYGYKRAFTVTPDATTIDRIRRLAALRADRRQLP